MARKTLAEILNGETRFGRLTVEREAAPHKSYRKARCRCDCGTVVDVFTFSLTGGKTQSCGCLHSERARIRTAAVGKANRKHGKTGTPEYQALRAAIDRCERKESHAYNRYGGRGITVCDRWRHSFEAFYADMGPKPSKRHTLERVNNERGYDPSNCEWRLWEPQNRNRRNTVMVEWRGMTVPLSKIAARAKIDYGNLHRRVFKLGWDLERAIRQPLRVLPKRNNKVA